MTLTNSGDKDTATLKFYGQIDYYHWRFNGREFDRWFNEYDAKYKNININLHCYGGQVFEGEVIGSTIKAAKAYTTGIVVGVAASMGAMILQKFKYRKMVRNGFIMVHAPSSGQSGTAQKHREAVKLLEDIEKNFINDIVERTGKKSKEVAKLFDGNDHWFNAQEALDYGLIDEIIDPVATIKQLDKQQAQHLGQEAVFERFEASLKSEIPKEQHIMDKTTLIAKAGLTGVTADSSDTAIFDALEGKINKERKAREKAEQELKAVNEESIKAAIDKAINDKLTTEKKRDFYTNMGKQMGIKALNEALADLKPHKTITSRLEKSEGTPGAVRDNWTWDDYQEKDSDALEAMEQNDYESFKALFKAKYKDEPSNN